MFFRRWKQSTIIYFVKGLLGQPQMPTKTEVLSTHWPLNLFFFFNQMLIGIAFCFRIIPSFLSDFFLPQIRNRVAEVPGSCDDGGIVSICNMLRTSLSSSLLNTSNQKWGEYSNKASCFCQHSSIREDGLSPLNLTCPEYMSSFQQTWAAQSSPCPADLARERRTLPNCTKLCV